MHELARTYLASVGAGESRRAATLRLLEAYYGGHQYDHLPHSWEQTVDRNEQPIPFRARRPSDVLPIPRQIVDVFNRALWGAGRRPKASLADDPEAPDLLDDIIAEAKLYRVMHDASRRALTIGSGVVVWKIQDGRIRADAWDAASCAPTFKPTDPEELESIDYRFKFSREVRDPLSGHLRSAEFWHREVVSTTTWTRYREVEVRDGAEPEWVVDQAVEHNLGVCPAAWIRIGERSEAHVDGTGVIAPFLGLIDEACYVSSQAGRALHYNLDPVPVVSGTAADVDLDKGGKRAWVFDSKDAKVELLESNGKYIESAAARLKEIRQSIFDAAGITMIDPERVAGAQSGASLELLFAPQIARVDELREQVGEPFERLLGQILRALGSESLAPARIRIDVRDRKSRTLSAAPRVVLTWGGHFPLTPSDAASAAEAASKSLNVGAISRQAAARYLARFFGVEDVEADQKLVEADEARQDKRMTGFDARVRQADGLDEASPE